MCDISQDLKDRARVIDALVRRVTVAGSGHGSGHGGLGIGGGGGVTLAIPEEVARLRKRLAEQVSSTPHHKTRLPTC